MYLFHFTFLLHSVFWERVTLCFNALYCIDLFRSSHLPPSTDLSLNKLALTEIFYERS